MTSCTINNSRMAIYTVIISVTNNKTQDTASSIFYCTSPYSVKPAPVLNLTAKDLKENGCFSISFVHNATYWNKSFDVYIQDSNSKEWKLYRENLTDTNLKVCDLMPYISINISIKCCPAGIFKGICSDPSNISYMTPQIAPSLGPMSVNGTYSTENCINGKDRNVTLFWKDVNKADLNGLLKEYEIIYRDNVKKTSKEAYQITIQIPCNSVEMVHIFAVNDAGKSIQPTTLVIAPYSFKVPDIVEQSLSVEVSDTKALLLWKEDNSQSLVKTVFWCESMNNRGCEGKISWQSVPENQTSQTITDINPRRTNFGLTVSDKNKTLTSAIVWFQCYFDPQKSLPQINIMKVEPDQQSAIIIWEVIKCSKSSFVKVTGYSVKYCVKTLCEDYANIKSEDVHQDESSYKISNMIADETYEVAVAAKSGNITGPESKWMQVQPVSPQNLLLVPVTVSVSTVFVLLMVVLIVALINKCGKSKKKMESLIITRDEHLQNKSSDSQSSSETSEAIYPEEAQFSSTLSDLSKTGQHFHCESSDSSGGSDDNSRCKLIPKLKVQKQKLQYKEQAVEEIEIFPKDSSVGQHIQTHTTLDLLSHPSTDEHKHSAISPYLKFQLSSSCERKSDTTLFISNVGSDESEETMKSDTAEVIPEPLRTNSCSNYVVDKHESLASYLMENLNPISTESPVDISPNSSNLENLQNSHNDYMVVNEHGYFAYRPMENLNSQNVQDVSLESPVVLGQNFLENVQLSNNLSQRTDSIFRVQMSHLPGPGLNSLHSPCDTQTNSPSTESSDVKPDTEALNSLDTHSHDHTNMMTDYVTSTSSSQLVPDINSHDWLSAVQHYDESDETQSSPNCSLDDLPSITFSCSQTRLDSNTTSDYVAH